MRFTKSLLFQLIFFLSPLISFAQSDLESKRQAGTIPALMIIGLLVLIQLSAFANAFIYYFKGELKSLLLSLIPTVLTLIITSGIILLQLFRTASDLNPFLLFALFLCFILSVIGMGWRKHSITYIHPERFSLNAPMESLLNHNFNLRK